MSFGLQNSPATFQHLMNWVEAGLEECTVYPDEIIIYSEICFLYILFSHLVEASLKMNQAKIEFARANAIYLGKVTGQGQVHRVHAKVEAIDKFLSLTTKRQAMHFLGMVAFGLILQL